MIAKISKITVATLGLALSLTLAGCPKEKKVEPEALIQSIVGAMCKKMATCQPNAMPSEDFCQNTMKAALSGNKNLPNIQASQKQLDACVKSIESAECDGLLGAKPPKDCEFLQ